MFTNFYFYQRVYFKISNLQNVITSLEGSATSESGSFNTESMISGYEAIKMITFENPFSTIPTVILGTNNGYITPTVQEVSKGGFTTYYKNTYKSNSSAIIDWNATADIM